MHAANDGFVGRDQEFPQRIQRRIGHMLREWDGTTPIRDGEDFVALTRWVSENYSGESIYESEWDLPTPVSLGDIETWYQNQLHNGEMQPLSRKTRRETLEMRIAERFERLETALETEGSLFGIRSCGAVALRRRKQHATLFYVQTGGYFFDWYGVFPDLDSFSAALREDGFMLLGQPLEGEMRQNVRTLFMG